MKLLSGRTITLLVLVMLTGVGLYHQVKPLPTGLAISPPPRPASEVRFLFDATWVDASGQRRQQHQIFDHMLELISGARQLVLVDAFLINDFAGDPGRHRALGQELAAALAKQQQLHPDLRVVLITDPFNTLYGGVENAYLAQLREHRIRVVETPLTPLRDPNPLWSSVWRICCQWFGNDVGGGWLPNPVGDEPVTLRTYLALLNFKANHRKTLLVDSPQGWVGLVSSGNPHDASSAHSNVALRFDGDAVRDLYHSEKAVLDLAGVDTGEWSIPEPTDYAATTSMPTVQLLTESRIRERVLALLDKSSVGDQIRLSMFYFSHREIVAALIDAHRRGARVQGLIDPSEDAFGRKKNGIPNRQVAGELDDAGIEVRWCDTHGEQCHSKALLIDRPDHRSALLLGSGNFTRRNLDDYNLETSVLLEADAGHRAVADARELFLRQWFNLDGQRFSVPYSHYQDDSRWRYLLYRIMEFSGLSTF